MEVGESMEKKNQTGKRKRSVPKKVDWKALEIVHPEAAGIDVGGSEHWVAVSPDRDPEPVRRFGCFTADLHEMGRWLVEKGVRSVALQSTGVYWMPVFEILEQHGLEVYLTPIAGFEALTACGSMVFHFRSERIKAIMDVTMLDRLVE